MTVFAQWMAGTDLHRWVEANGWLWPILEIGHFMGLCLLIGALLVMDLRLMGLFRAMPFPAVNRLAPVAGVGLGINVVTGMLFFAGDPLRYGPNPIFQLKMLLVALSLINLAYVTRRLPADPDQENPSWDIRLAAGLSLTVWVTVIVLGRFIPFYE